MKPVIIHVGPPKTGTSAIQRWCINNAKLLASEGIFYPEHDLDKNGVSSGNLLSVCNIENRDKEKKSAKVTVSTTKLKNTMELFYESNCKLMLLSSEFFIQHLETLKKVIPNVRFIAYLRNPIEVIESNYNQGVKRSGFTNRIKRGNFRSFPHLNFIVEYLKKHTDNSLSLRLYNPFGEANFDIVKDFFSTLNMSVNSPNLKVNNSYNLEALEYKRWINQFELSTFFVHRLDCILQGYDRGTSDYSFVSCDDLDAIKSNYVKKMKGLSNDLSVKAFDGFIELIENYEASNYREQIVEKSDFLKVCAYVDKELGAHCYPFNSMLTEQLNGKSDDYSVWYFTSHKVKPAAKLLYLRKKIVNKLKR